MAEEYFKKFPLINYNEYAAINITERVVVTEEAFRNPFLFYPYDLAEGQRPDQLADKYYNDQYLSWMLYMSNNVVDPYYDWYLSEKDFHLFLCKKYFNLGLIVQSRINELQNKIMFYRNNWYEDKDAISTSEYNALPVELYRYWEPIYSGTTVIKGYQRVEEDWTINTNKFVKYQIVGKFPLYKKEEIVHITGGAKGQVEYSVIKTIEGVEHSIIMIKNFSGSTGTIGTNYTIQGLESGNSRNFTRVEFGKELDRNGNSISIDVLNNFSAAEAAYWSPVTIYDYEKEKNEQKRSINVIDSKYAMNISRQLTKLLK
jgi:hypothetical protein